MLIAIASDLHDNLANWDIFNKQIKKQEIKTLLFCGDLCNTETLEHISKSFVGNIYIINGNGELYDEKIIKKSSQFNHLGRYGSFNLDNLKIGLIHEFEFRVPLEKETPLLDFVFYGHTHKPWLIAEHTLMIINPGTLGGVFYPASYATLDTKTKEIKLITLFK